VCVFYKQLKQLTVTDNSKKGGRRKKKFTELIPSPLNDRGEGISSVKYEKKNE